MSIKTRSTESNRYCSLDNLRSIKAAISITSAVGNNQPRLCSANGKCLKKRGIHNSSPAAAIASITPKIRVTIITGTKTRRGDSHKQYKLPVPYGFEFNTKQQVVDFLVGYQRYLNSQGFTFNEMDADLKEKRDWVLSAKEFLHWTTQGWRTGSLLALTPVSNTLTYVNPLAVVDEIKNSPFSSRVLDINSKVIKRNNFTVFRENNEFKFIANNEQSIGFAELNVVQHEHIVIFDNQTVFNDVIYAPELGNRQYRLKVTGSKTDLWNGSFELPGFMYSNPDVDPWVPVTDYLKGTIVTYKGKYFTLYVLS